MKIMYKLMAGFLLLVLMFSIAGAVVVSNLQVIESVDADVSISSDINQYASNYERGARKLQVGTYMYSRNNIDMGRQLIEEGKGTMLTNRENLKNVLESGKTKKELAEIERLELLSIEASDQVVDRIKQSDISEGLNEEQLTLDINFMEARVEALNLKLGTFVDKTQEDTTESLKVATDTGKQTVKVTYLAIGISLLISLVVAFVSSKMITDPVTYLTGIANRVSKGDMTEKIEVSSSDEIGDLASSFKRMINAFKIMEAMTREEAEK